MPGIDVPLATMAGIKETMISTSEEILRLRSARCQALGELPIDPKYSQGDRLGDVGVVSLCLPF